MQEAQRWRLALPGLLSLVLAACQTLPTGPTVAVMPPAGKPLDLFQQEDLFCRNYATQSFAPDAASQGQRQVLGSAVLGSALGALVGSAVGGDHQSAGAGAAVGLAMGGLAGAGRARDTAMSDQARYNIAYEQCMSSKGNVVPPQLPARRIRIRYEGGYGGFGGFGGFGYPGW